MTFGDADDPPAVPQPGAHVLDRSRGLAAVRVDLVGGEDLAVTAPASVSMSNETRAPIESRSSGSSVGAAANGDRLHQARPLPRACDRTSPSDMYAAAPRSIGASPPPAAAAHDASRNSWLVATRSCARARTRSGSLTTTWVPAGIRSTSSSISSTRTGASDSMPSTACPSASFSNSSASSGCSFASTAARARTSSVSSSSRHGGAHRPCWAISSERWSATAKYRISSTSSPKKSTRSGCSSVGGKTSMMPPRTANSPRRSTRSTRWYAAPASRSTTSSSSTESPTCSCTGRRSASPATCGCSTDRTGATRILIGPVVSSDGSGCASRRSTASRRPTVSERGDRRSCGSVSQAG